MTSGDVRVPAVDLDETSSKLGKPLEVDVHLRALNLLAVPDIAAQKPGMTPSLALDHLVVSARTLEEGTIYVSDMLGVSLSAVGRHDRMGTHNRLLSLGPDVYFEVIAIDPDAAAPPHPRWFDLDSFEGVPRITNWVCRTNDLDGALAQAPKGTGAAMALERAEYRWRFAVPPDGRLPFDGACPALIQWDSDEHPAPALADSGIRLKTLDIEHPAAKELTRAFSALGAVANVRFAAGAEKRFIATFETPEGLKVMT